MAESLQWFDRLRRCWVADMSYELHMPLAVLRGEIDVLVDGVRHLKPEDRLSLSKEVLRLGSFSARSSLIGYVRP
jgi:two-component system, OmpR family, sensor histidine kinase BaeS